MDIRVSQLYKSKNIFLDDLGEGEYIEKAKQFIHTEGPILILGETGVGKNLLAQAMHNERSRSSLLINVDDIIKKNDFWRKLDQENGPWQKIKLWLSNDRVKITKDIDNLHKVIQHINNYMETYFFADSSMINDFLSLQNKSNFYMNKLISQLRQRKIIPLEKKKCTEKKDLVKQHSKDLQKAFEDIAINKKELSRIDLLWLNRLILEACSDGCLAYSQTGIFCEVTSTGIPENLFEAELLGIKKGTATDVDEREGLIKTANRGTLFLDEIGDISLYLQSKLLRFIEQKYFLPVGAREEEESDTFIICATNKKLSELQDSKFFRQDLFYRLYFSIEIPPIDKREADKQIFINKFIHQYAKDIYENKNITTPVWIKTRENSDELKVKTAETLSYLMDYPWPGNIREMKFAIRSILYSALNDVTIEFKHFPLNLQKYFFVKEIKKYFPQNTIFTDLNWKYIKDLYISFIHNSEMRQKTAAEKLGVDEKLISYFKKGVTENPISLDKLQEIYFTNVYNHYSKENHSIKKISCLLETDEKTIKKFLKKSPM